MTIAGWHEEPIAKQHDRAGFDCGQPELNAYLKTQARQSHERGGAKTFLAIDDVVSTKILGYYTLSPASVEYARAPAVVQRNLGRYDIGAYRLSRLAVGVEVQGQGLGGQLLLAAGRRCLRVASEVGGSVMLIDAKNEKAAAWYAGFGALALLDAPLTLVLPLEMIAAASRLA